MSMAINQDEAYRLADAVAKHAFCAVPSEEEGKFRLCFDHAILSEAASFEVTQRASVILNNALSGARWEIRIME